MFVKNKSLRFKINLVFIFFMLLFITSSIFIYKQVSNNYINHKIAEVKEYYYQNPNLKVEQYLDYLLQNGFIITSENQNAVNINNINPNNLNKSFTQDDLTIYSEHFTFTYKDQEYNIILNPTIVNDILHIIKEVTIILIIMFIFCLLSINLLLNKLFLKKIKKIENYITNYNFEEKQLIFSTKDELGNLLDQINVFLQNIDSMNEEKKILINTFSHELKTPLARIEAINYLYENNDEDYQNFEQVKKEISQEILEMKKLISEALYVFDNKDVRQEIISIKELVLEHFQKNNNIILQKKLQYVITGDSIKVKANPIYIDLIIRNIISNMFKHSASKTKLIIEFNDNKISFKNDYHYNQAIQKGYGNKLIDKLCEQCEIKVTRKEQKGIFIIDLEIIEN